MARFRLVRQENAGLGETGKDYPPRAVAVDRPRPADRPSRAENGRCHAIMTNNQTCTDLLESGRVRGLIVRRPGPQVKEFLETCAGAGSPATDRVRRGRPRDRSPRVRGGDPARAGTFLELDGGRRRLPPLQLKCRRRKGLSAFLTRTAKGPSLLNWRGMRGPCVPGAPSGRGRRGTRARDGSWRSDSAKFSFRWGSSPKSS